MKFYIESAYGTIPPCKKAYKYKSIYKINIEKIEDLKAIQEEVGFELIIDFKDMEITIHDDYVE